MAMKRHSLKFVSLIAFALAVAFALPQRAAADQDDPPGRIARLSVAEGSVSFQPAGTDDWVSAVVNRPMTIGDKLWSDQNSRAELHLGSASIRLGASTGFSFLNLDDNTVQLQLTEGTLRIRVRHLDRDEIFEVDTPNLAFTAVRPGIYRINVNEAGDTTVVVVRDGQGQVTGGGQSYSVDADETGTFTGTDQLTADIEGVGDQDDLERWSYERDRREDHSASRRYVSDEAIGYEDLDENGGWRDTRDYGAVWFPHTTVVGWAPYRYGHWVWIAPWGYTWVDDEPWGFAPFHYGRWVVVGNSWGWIPCRPAAVVGVAYVRPVYAPALVAWVGGGGFAVGVSAGGGAAVGWFPLGPREVYVPSYAVSRAYVNRVNITNTTVNTTVVNNYYTNVVVNKNVTNVRYVNQTAPGAVTATSTQTFTSGQSVHNNVVRVDERQIANSRAVATAPAVAPTRQSVVGVGRQAAARPPATFATRAVVAKTAPPPPPARFEQQRAAIEQNGGRPLATAQVRQIQQQQQQPKAPVRIAPPARTVTPPPQNAASRPGPPQNANRPVQQPNNQQPSNAQQNNRPAAPPANAERPNNGQPNQNNRPPNADRPNTPPANAERPNNGQPNQQNRPPNADRPNIPPANAERPNNAQPNQQNRPPNADRPNTPPANAERPNNAQPNQNNRPANAERPNTPPANEQPNRPATPPANAERPNAQANQPPNNGRNDRPPSARPSNLPPPNGNPQLERQHQQELENMRKQQDQERQRVERQQAQDQQRANQQKVDDQRRQQMEQQHQQQLQDLERQHQQQQQQVQQRQQQEHQQQQQRPPQAERQPAPRQQQPPPQAERQPAPRQQQQQEKPKDKPKEKDKPPKS